MFTAKFGNRHSGKLVIVETVHLPDVDALVLFLNTKFKQDEVITKEKALQFVGTEQHPITYAVGRTAIMRIFKDA